MKFILLIFLSINSFSQSDMSQEMKDKFQKASEFFDKEKKRNTDGVKSKLKELAAKFDESNLDFNDRATYNAGAIMSFVKKDPNAIINIDIRTNQIRVVMQYLHFNDKSIGVIEFDKDSFDVISSDLCRGFEGNCSLW